jgi:hypothetical protein
MYLYFVVKSARFLPKMATNTLEMAGFSTEKTWFFSFQESSGYINSTENTAKVLSAKTTEFEGSSWHFRHEYYSANK